MAFQDILNNIFGGGSQNTSSTSSATPVNMTPVPYQGLQNPFAGTLNGLLQSGMPQYRGPLSADIQPNEQYTLDNLMKQQGTTGANSSSYINDVISGKYLPGQSGANPFLNAAIMSAQRPTLNSLENVLTQDLPGRFTQAGHMTQPGSSSAFDKAASDATRGVAQSISDIATNMSSGAYTTERAHQDTAVGLGQQEVATTVQNLQAQALPRMIQELGIERGMQVFQSQTASLLQLLQTIGGVAAPVIASSSKSESSGSGYNAKGIIPSLATLIPGPGKSGSGTASG